MTDAKAITDAPNLRASYRNMCGNCAYFKWISDGDGACSKFEASVEEEFVCDAWEEIAPAPLPVVVVEAPEAEKSIETNALKTISKNDDEIRAANYMVVFGGRDLTAFAFGKNKDGSMGEYFTRKTDFESDYTKSGVLHVDFEHGVDPDDFGIGKDAVLGYVDWKTAKIDERGVFVERVLSRRNKYIQWVEELIDAGLIGNSTEAMPQEIVKAENGEIKKWPLRRDTLTVNPMEPRMLMGNHLQAVRALSGVIPSLKSLIPAHAVDTEADNKAIEPIKEIQMEKEEFKAILDGFKEEVKTIAADAAQKAVNDLPEIKTARAVEVVTDEADRPFTTMAEQASAIKAWTVTSGQRADPRLSRLTAWSKAALGANEGTPSEGGFMLEPTLTGEFLKPMHEAGAFTSMVRRLPVGNNSNYGWINGADETSRADGSRWGGVQGYWLAEAGTKTASQPKFRRINWELKKVIAAMYATDELLADAAQFSAVANQSAGEEIDFQVNDALLNGNGVGKPLGVLQSGALVSVSRVATSAIGHADILNMWQRLSPRSRANAVWFVNSDAEPQLDALYFATGSNGVLSPYVSYDQTGVMRLKGRPVMVTEFSPSLGSAGDLLLADMSQYLFWEKGGIQSASSIHVQFLTDQTVFRFVYRCDGQTADYSPVTPYKGSNTQSAFVALASTTG